MRRSGKRPPLRLLRGVLLTIMVIVIGGIGGLYFIGRTSRPTPAQPQEQKTNVALGELLRGEGFEHEVTREGRKIFVIRAERITSDEEDHFRLEDVELVFDRDNGDQYTIHSDWSTYDRNTDAAVLKGAVRLLGPNHLTLITEGLELKRQGSLVVSSAPVRFGIAGEYEGEAERISIDLRRDEFSLSGAVKLQRLSQFNDSLSLECEKLSFERRRQLIRAEGSVDIKGGGENRLRARRVSILLSDNEKTPRFLRARWGLRGRFEQSTAVDSQGIIDFEGTDLSIFFEENSRRARKIELEGTANQAARIQLNDGTSGAERTIRSKHIEGEMSNGSIQSLQLLGDVVIEERSSQGDPEVLLRASGRVGQAQFDPDGGLKTFSLENTVKLDQGNLSATGIRLEINLSTGMTEIVGSPVILKTDRGVLRAKRVIHFRDTDEIQALEGVKSVLTGSKGQSLWGAQGATEPIQVESASAVWNEGEVRFSSRVKAWQKDSFLLADEMVIKTDSDRLAATGSVRTVWRPQPDPSDDAASGPLSPVEVNADKLVYSKSEQVLTYSGSARLRQDGRTLSCDTMQVTTGDNEEIQALDCDGRARLEDPSSGNTVEGTVIAYRPKEHLARISGDSVILRDQQGTQIEGKQLLYNFQDGTAKLESRSEAIDPVSPLPTE